MRNETEWDNNMKERLSFIKAKMASRRITVFYAWYSPKATYMYDTEDALEDFLWMIAEIERLRIENNDLQSPRYAELKKSLLQKSLAEKGKATKELKTQRARRKKG
jgi:hypothetical protein